MREKQIAKNFFKLILQGDIGETVLGSLITTRNKSCSLSQNQASSEDSGAKLDFLDRSLNLCILLA